MVVEVLISILLVNVFTVNSQKCNKTASLSFSNLDKIPHFNFDPCVTSLQLTDSNISNFEDGVFNNLPNLKELDLSSNRIPPENLFSFGSLPNLTLLDLRYQKSNITGRELEITIKNSFPNLEILQLTSVLAEKVSVENWTALMPNLRELDMSFNIFLNFSDLLRNFPPKLKELKLEANDISFLNLTGYSTLEYAYLSLNKFRSLLITDDPRSCQSTGQLCVGWMSSLRVLSVHLSQIEVFDFHYVSSDPLPKLAELDLYGNEFKTINYLSLASLHIPKLPSLYKLNLGFNQLKSIESLCPLQKVPFLILDRTMDPSFSFELSKDVDECLTSLRSFHFNKDVKGYSLKEIPKQFFSKLTNLDELLLEGHELTDLTGVPRFLSRLNVCGNKIEVEKNIGLEYLTTLQYLNIGRNPVVKKIETDGFKGATEYRSISVDLTC